MPMLSLIEAVRPWESELGRVDEEIAVDERPSGPDGLVDDPPRERDRKARRFIDRSELETQLPGQPVIPGSPEHPGRRDGGAAFLDHGYARGRGREPKGPDEALQEFGACERRRRDLGMRHHHVRFDRDASVGAPFEAELGDALADDLFDGCRVVLRTAPEDHFSLDRCFLSSHAGSI
jgi:hypothetical protein